MNGSDETVQAANRKAVSDRLRLAISEAGMTLDAFAGASGVPLSSLKRWVSGISDPAFGSIMVAAEVAGVRLDWLATGKGPMRSNDTDPNQIATATLGAVVIDRELMGRCVDAISKLYQDLNIRIPMIDVGRDAADLHDDVMASGAGPDEYAIAIRSAIAQRRRALLAAPPSKRQDSA